MKQTFAESLLQSVPCWFKGHSLNSQRVCIFAFYCSALVNRFNSLINGRSRNPAVQMSRSEFIWKNLVSLIQCPPRCYDTRPDLTPLTALSLLLNMVSPVAVAMVTLQHITVALQHKVLCEQGNEGRRDRGGRDSGRTKTRTAAIKRRATFTKLFVSHDTRSAT